MPFLTGAEYLALPIGSENWIIDRLLPVGGLANLYGKPKASKSYLALQIAEAISQGKSHILGLAIRKHGPVAYLQIDTARSVWRSKHVQDLHAHGYDLSRVMFHDRQSGTPFPFNILEQQTWLKRELEEGLVNAAGECELPVLLVVDTLRESHAGDENDSGVMRNVLNAYVAATKDINCGVLILSHRKKETQFDSDDLRDGNRGSGHVAAAMDTIMELSKPYLRFTGRATDLQSIAITRPVEDTGIVALAPEEQRLLDTLRLIIQNDPQGTVSDWTVALKERMGGLFHKKELSDEGWRSHVRRKKDLVLNGARLVSAAPLPTAGVP